MSTKVKPGLNKRSQKPWECSDPECKGSDKIMCKHLEALMPKDATVSVRAYLDYNIDRHGSQPKISIKQEEKLFREKLKLFGLEKIRIDVLTYRFVYGWSFGDIATHLKIPHRPTAYDIYRRSLDLLKERGYKL